MKILKKLKQDSQESLVVKKLVVLAFLTTMMVCIKYLLSNLPGIELVTFLVCLYAFYLPLKDTLFIIVLFNLITLLFNGLSPGNLMYGIIFPFNACVIYCLRSGIKQRYSFALLTGTLAGLLSGGYFLSDLIFFDAPYALTKLITAFPIATIAFIANFLVAGGLFKPLNRVFNANMSLIQFNYININVQTLQGGSNYFVSTLTATILIVGMVFLIIYQSLFLQLAANIQYLWSGYQVNKNQYDYSYKSGILKEQEYFAFQKAVIANKQCGIVALYDANTFFKATINECDQFSLQDVIFNRFALEAPDKFYFTEVSSKNNDTGGKFIGDLGGFKNGIGQVISQGTYPSIFTGDVLSLTGATNIKLQVGTIYQISYAYQNEFNWQGF